MIPLIENLLNDSKIIVDILYIVYDYKKLGNTQRELREITIASHFWRFCRQFVFIAKKKNYRTTSLSEIYIFF